MKKFAFILLLFIFAFCFLIFDLYSQQPTEEWVARYPGPCNDFYGPYLAVDKQGNSYIAGTHVINDSINILCVKYSTTGTQPWATFYKYPGNRYFAPAGLALDSSGNAYVTSVYALNAVTAKKLLIVKFSSVDGTVQWVRTYAGQYGIETQPSDIKIDRLNNIYVAGWADSSLLCIKYNVSGDTLWVRQYHAQMPVIEAAFACAVDDSLNIIMTGQRRYMGGIDTLLTVKYNTVGFFRWAKTYFYDNLINRGKKIVTDQNGNIYIGAETRISSFFVFLTLKYDRNGNQQWAKIYDAPGSGGNYLRSIVMDRINNALFVTGGAVSNGIPMATAIRYNILTGDSVWVKKSSGNNNGAGGSDIKVDTIGNVYITGATYNYPSYDPYDIMTFKYSLQGNPIWLITYNYASYNGWDNGLSLELKNNNIYVLGTSLSSAQVTDYVVIKYNQLIGIEPISNEIPYEYKLEQNYPNPFNPYTKIRFSVSKTGFVLVKIYDILGRIIEIPVNEKLQPLVYEFTLDALKYSSGVYFYQLIADGNIIDTKKMVLIK